MCSLGQGVLLLALIDGVATPSACSKVTFGFGFRVCLVSPRSWGGGTEGLRMQHSPAAVCC